jgi:hypothetical protein
MSVEATYCPEDNKLRLYCGHVPREEYEALRAGGWTSTPKQDCDFVATWSPEREDTARGMLDEGDDIGDEDQGPEDRAADRAERFARYRDNRRRDAGGLADRFDAGPSVHGHQDAGRAQRAAARHDRQRTGALSQWDKAEYWQTRTMGVIGHAMHTTSAPVRRERIVRLETERRRVRDGSRWAQHLDLRIAYERQMLEAQGGTAADLEMVPGGWVGGFQIIKVNKSPATGAVVSVSVYAPKAWHRGEGPAPLTLQTLNVQRFGENVYRAPAPEDLETLSRTLADKRARAQARSATTPKLLNPTDEDAERLQSWINAKARERHAASDARHYGHPPASVSVTYMTQAQFSARSKGTYSPYNTEYLGEDGRIYPHERQTYGPTVRKVCKLRTAPNGVSSFYAADSVVVLTDKPRHELPAWGEAVQADADEAQAALVTVSA